MTKATPQARRLHLLRLIARNPDGHETAAYLTSEGVKPGTIGAAFRLGFIADALIAGRRPDVRRAAVYRLTNAGRAFLAPADHVPG